MYICIISFYTWCVHLGWLVNKDLVDPSVPVGAVGACVQWGWGTLSPRLGPAQSVVEGAGGCPEEGWAQAPLFVHSVGAGQGLGSSFPSSYLPATSPHLAKSDLL